jgi:hypothetical protein
MLKWTIADNQQRLECTRLKAASSSCFQYSPSQLVWCPALLAADVRAPLTQSGELRNTLTQPGEWRNLPGGSEALSATVSRAARRPSPLSEGARFASGLWHNSPLVSGTVPLVLASVKYSMRNQVDRGRGGMAGKAP